MTDTIRLADDVREALSKAEVTETSVKLVGQLSRELYVRVNKVLETVGGKWNRKAQAHLFTRDPREALGLAQSTGQVVDQKKRLQAFYTPKAVADRMAAELRLSSMYYDLVLEPSAGEGALCDAVLGKYRQFSADNIFCYEINPKSVTVLTNKGYTVKAGDFLQSEPVSVYDRVIMNPPFTKGQDIDHVTHALKFLTTRGRLVAIMTTGWQIASTHKAREFRRMLDEDYTFYHATRLPPCSFKESGTDVQTIMLVVDK